MIDATDREILRLLQEDSRMQWKEIGQRVHMTGQAVGARIRKLEELGVIEGFTVRLDPGKLGRAMTAMVTVFMKTTDHAAFAAFLAGEEAVLEAHRVSGEGCYWLKVAVGSSEELSEFLDGVLRFGNYRVNLSIGKLKS